MQHRIKEVRGQRSRASITTRRGHISTAIIAIVIRELTTGDIEITTPIWMILITTIPIVATAATTMFRTIFRDCMTSTIMVIGST